MIDPAALRAEVTEHPWRSVALAFATGAYLALVETGPRSARTLSGLLTTTLLAASRDVVMRRLARIRTASTARPS
jgi:hypothetical protein